MTDNIRISCLSSEVKEDVVLLSMTYHRYLVHQAEASLREIKHPLVCKADVPECTFVSSGSIFRSDHNEEGILKFYVVEYVDYSGNVVSCKEYKREDESFTTTTTKQEIPHIVPLDIVEVCLGN